MRLVLHQELATNVFSRVRSIIISHAVKSEMEEGFSKNWSISTTLMAFSVLYYGRWMFYQIKH